MGDSRGDKEYLGVDINVLFNRIKQIVTLDKALLNLKKLTIDEKTPRLMAPLDI